MSLDQNNRPDSPEIDLALLNVARSMLESSGFTVAESSLPDADVPWLLAENGLFALGVVAGRRLSDLVVMETHGTAALAERMDAAGPKRWDVYLVLLAREDRDSRGSREVRRIQYDTNLLRRVVSLGVQADSESVRSALRPFLPLPPPSEQFIGSAWRDLVSELMLQGVDESQAQAVVQSHIHSEAAL